MPRILDAAGCCVHTLGDPASGFSKTRFSRRHFPVTGGAHVVARALIARHSGAAEPYRHVIVADDALLSAVIALRAEPAAKAVLPVRSEAALDLIGDNYLLLRAVAQASVATPASVQVAEPRELAAAAGSIGYPLLLKDPAGAGGAGVRRVDTAAQLADASAGLRATAPIVQRFVEGKLGCTQVLYDRGRLCLASSYYAHDCYPTAFGPSTVRESADHLDVAPIARVLGGLTGFHGLCGFDWIEDAAGRLFFLEFNARPVYLEAALQRQFGGALADVLRGSPEPAETPAPRTRSSSALFPGHAYFSLERGRYADLLAWLPGRATSAEVPWSDPPLLLHELRAIARWFVLRKLASIRANANTRAAPPAAH